MHHEERGVAEQVGGPECVEGHELVQGVDRHLVAPARARRPVGSVVLPRLLARHGGRALPGDGRHPSRRGAGLLEEAGQRLTVGGQPHLPGEGGRVVVGPGDAGDGPQPGIGRGRPQRVPAAETVLDGDALAERRQRVPAAETDPDGGDSTHVGPGPQDTDGCPQVRELPARILASSRQAAAVAEVAVVDRERDDAPLGEQGGVGADDLVLDARERAGQYDPRARAGGRRLRPVYVAGKLDAVDGDADVLPGAHAACPASSPATASMPSPTSQASGASGSNRVIVATSAARSASLGGSPPVRPRTASRTMSR